MTTNEIRQKYLDFMKSKQHVMIPRANIVPQDDPTTLFTGSGMQPMVPYLLGAIHPQGKRLTNSQVCFRAQDIDEVGDGEHTTAFEMLGNWSLGDYYKVEQITWISEFLFDVVGLDPQKVYVSCYIGNKKYNIPRDNTAIELWQEQFKKRGIDAKVVEIGAAENGAKTGMQDGRIFLYDGKENWWSRNGDEEGTSVGDPCGPDSEMFFDFGEEYHDEEKWGKAHPASDSSRFFEIGNNVFMGYRKTEDGFEELKAPNIDHGSGLERIAAASLGDPDVFKISLLWPIIQKIEEISGKKYEDNKESMQVIADHLRGAVFMAVDGIIPSNKEQGYVSRRLMRRAIMNAHDLGIEQDFVQKIVPLIADLYHETYPEVAERREQVIDALVKEEKIFRQTLRKGLSEFFKQVNLNVNNSAHKITSSEANLEPQDHKKEEELTGEALFRLHDTFGFPVELSQEEATKRDIKIAKDADQVFKKLLQEQRQRSQTATKGTFKGGLADDSDATTKHHSATHLMYEALRRVLGDHVVQRGSNVTGERIRFDFSHDAKMTDEQKAEVEKIVNEQIQHGLTVTMSEHPTDEAFKKGAKGAFGDKYGDKVKVYTMGMPDEKPFSVEICGGPHVESTSGLGIFKIIKEESSSSGVRRIKAKLIQ